MSLLLKMAGKGVAGSCLEISVGVAGHNVQIWYLIWFISPSLDYFLVPVQTECEFERKNSSRRQITYRHLETIEQEPKDFLNV